jgi:hypothetical protein
MYTIPETRYPIQDTNRVFPDIFSKTCKKTYQMLKKYQMAIIYTKMFNSKATQNVWKLGFLYESVPSGNPGIAAEG